MYGFHNYTELTRLSLVVQLCNKLSNNLGASRSQDLLSAAILSAETVSEVY